MQSALLYAVETEGKGCSLASGKLVASVHIADEIDQLLRLNNLTEFKQNRWVIQVVHNLTEKERVRLLWVLRSSMHDGMCYAEMRDKVRSILRKQNRV